MGRSRANKKHRPTQFMGSAMQTLDRRISTSSDNLDTIKQLKTRGRPVRTGSGTKLNWVLDGINSDDVNNSHKKGDINNFQHDKCQSKEKLKTPLEIFLENDGPYSRRFYGPVQHGKNGSMGQSKPGTDPNENWKFGQHISTEISGPNARREKRREKIVYSTDEDKVRISDTY